MPFLLQSSASPRALPAHRSLTVREELSGVETEAGVLLSVLRRGTVSTDVFLRRRHNFCLDMSWHFGLLVPRRQWPAVRFNRRIGVTLHCYRYSWAERAKAVGYPERFAQEALGQNSKAVHRAYAKRAIMKLPSLEEFERSAAAKATPLPKRTD